MLRLDPLPCWRHLSPEQYRARITQLVKEIEDRCLADRQARGVEPPGPAVVRAQRPFDQPMKTKKSPAPFVHAFRKKVRRELYRAYAAFVAAYREAAERLKAGDLTARFPEGSFPPHLPFVGAVCPAG